MTVPTPWARLSASTFCRSTNKYAVLFAVSATRNVRSHRAHRSVPRLQAADHFYSARDYPKSLELYSLSNVEADKLVHRFLSICPNEIISYLRTILKEVRPLSHSSLSRLSPVRVG